MITVTFRKLIALMIVCLATPSVSAAAQPYSEQESGAVEAFVNATFAGSEFAMVVGMIDENGTHVFGAGPLDNGTNMTADGDTLFEIGSVTKTFASLLLLEMAHRGEVQPDDPVWKFLPDEVRVPDYQGTPITLENLAAQDSGLPFNATNHIDADTLTSYNAYSVSDLYEFLSGYVLTEAPGTRFTYSNVGFSLLGHVIDRISGSGFESLLIDRVLDPLDMADTRITLSAEQASRMAAGHGADGERTGNYDFQVMQAAGALNSSVNDMLKYLAAQLGTSQTPLLSVIEQSHETRHENQPNVGKTAMPWIDRNVFQPDGANFLGHAGGSPGYSAFAGFDKGLQRGVVVLTNQTLQEADRRVWIAESLGWAILQGLPITPERGYQLVFELTGLGIGLELDQTTGFVRINQVFPQSAAGRAGLQAGTLIRTINGTSTEDKSMQECLDLMQGPEGTVVRLELMDPAADILRLVELTKDRFLTLG